MEYLVIACVPLTSITLFLVYLLLIVIVRKLFMDHEIPEESEKISTLIVLGSGGHTSEMLRLVSALDSTKYTPQMYIIAETDTSSMSKLKATKKEGKIEVIPRSREVGQSWLSTVFTTNLHHMHKHYVD